MLSSHFRIKKSQVEQLTKDNYSLTPIPDEWYKYHPLLKEEHPGPDYISLIFADLLLSLLRQNRVGTASNYQSSYNALKAFKGNVRLCEVTVNYLLEFESWMLNVRKNSKTTVRIYTRVLRVIMNEALERKLLHSEAYPFGRRKYLVPKELASTKTIFVLDSQEWLNM
jgi:integrase/recombinase XerD